VLNEAFSGSNQTLSGASDVVFYSISSPFIHQAGDNGVGFAPFNVILQSKCTIRFVVNGSSFLSSDIRKMGFCTGIVNIH
jgi:hypothetical protein